MDLRWNPALKRRVKQLGRKSPLVVAVAGALALACLPPAAHALDYEASYLGNSFSGAPNFAHVQDDIQGLYVGSDGTCYADSGWDEGTHEAGIYKNGQAVGSCIDTHGWGRSGGAAITADSNYIYMAMTQNGDDGANTRANVNGTPQYPAPNNQWYCIRRYNHDGSSAPFPSGSGYKGDMLIVNSSTRPNGQSSYPNLGITGVSVDAAGLYVSDAMTGQVKKYSLSTLSSTPVQTWAVTQPGALAAVNGSIFVIRGGAKPVVLQFSTTGTLQSTVTFAAGVKPTALGYNPKTGCLLVADNGPDQNVKEYSTVNRSGSPTRVKTTFGTKGGIFAGTGAQIGTAGPGRFNDPVGVGADSSGNIYVAQDGSNSVPGLSTGGAGAVLESYTGSTRNWQLYDLAFTDCADVDPASENDSYTKDAHWAMNWSKTAPGSEASYKGYTLNPFKYPQDPRLHAGFGNQANAWVRTIQGHKFLISTNMYAGQLAFFRFNAATDGETAIPSTLFASSHANADSTGWPENQPGAGEWIWRDANGDGAMSAGEYAQPAPAANAPSGVWGWWVDSKGDVWEATQTGGIRHFACQGLDSRGNPLYDFSHVTAAPMPSDFTDLERIEYFPATDTMYLSGYSNAQPNNNNYWKIIGRTICRYDHWSTGPTLHAGYPVVPPFNGTKTAASTVQIGSMDVAGSYLFTSHVAQNQIEVYSTDTGALVGTIVPTPAIGGNGTGDPTPLPLGWDDIPYGVRAYQRTSGEYDIFYEDDWLGKVVMYRWSAA
ncbi:MAG: hypothetical protein ACRYFS_04685 [Janthinobacterium lividum]